MDSDSRFDHVAQQLLQFETADIGTDQPIACIVIPFDTQEEIHEQQIDRSSLAEVLTTHFTAIDALHLDIGCFQIDIKSNPENSILYGIMLSEDRRGPKYNNRASELLEPTNVCSDLLVFSLNDDGTFVSYAPALRTTIAELCDHARNDTRWGTLWRSVSNNFAQTKLGKIFEGWNTPPPPSFD